MGVRYVLVFILFFIVASDAMAIDEGFSLSLRSQTLELHGSYIREDGGSNTIGPYLGYGLGFYRDRSDILRLNVGAQPIKSGESDVVYAFDATLSFLYEPADSNGWSGEVRFGPQFFTDLEEAAFLRGLAVHKEVGFLSIFEKTKATFFVGQSDLDDFVYLHFRAGLSVLY